MSPCRNVPEEPPISNWPFFQVTFLGRYLNNREIAFDCKCLPLSIYSLMRFFLSIANHRITYTVSLLCKQRQSEPRTSQALRLLTSSNPLSIFPASVMFCCTVIGNRPQWQSGFSSQFWYYPLICSLFQSGSSSVFVQRKALLPRMHFSKRAFCVRHSIPGCSV